MARNHSSQPTYDFLGGGDGDASPLRALPPPPTTSSRGDGSAAGTEALRARLHALQYELDALKQERELAALHQQQADRDATGRADAADARAHAAEAGRVAAERRAEQAAHDAQEVRTAAAEERAVLERRARGLQDESRALREEVEDARAEQAEEARASKRALEELGQKHATLMTSAELVRTELEGRAAALQSSQQKLGQSEAQIGELENEVLRLRAQTGDSDTLAIIKKELSEQVTYIKKLESINRDHLAELKQFRKAQKSIEVVIEEKHALEAKLRMMEDLRRELSEAQLQKRILEDEKRGWTSYLENEAAGEEDMTYDTPEQMAKAFLSERLERLTLLDKLGSMQPELAVKDANIESLEADKAKLHADLEEARKGGNTGPAVAGGAGDAKARSRLERQKNLMSKEIEYLRAQMKAFESETTEFNPEQADEERSKRMQDLEQVIDQYRSEVQSLNAELAAVETTPALSPTKKRAREEDEGAEQRLGEMRRKARSLQDDLDKLHTKNQVLEAELKASLTQIESLKESSRTRVLELRNNPTAQVEAVKMATLETLRAENQALLDQLEGRPVGTKVVPISTLENVRMQLEETQAQMAQTEKKTMRLKQIWGSKSLEFREAVCSILGWRLDFMPNGRVKATSILYPTLINNGEEEENSIVFDGENGTMKVSGGPKSMFANEIKGLIEFWVEGRKEIPCFLAACTLEFYDRTTRAARI